MISQAGEEPSPGEAGVFPDRTTPSRVANALPVSHFPGLGHPRDAAREHPFPRLLMLPPLRLFIRFSEWQQYTLGHCK